jgi:hypothetical protein
MEVGMERRSSVDTRPASSEVVRNGAQSAMSARSAFARFGVVVGTAVITACSAGLAHAGLPANVCTTTGVTPAVATKIFGHQAAAVYVTVHDPTVYCQVNQSSSDQNLEIVLYPKSAFQLRFAPFETGYSASYSKLALSGLGSGAGMTHFGQHPDVLFFKAANYTVEIDDLMNDAPYPTEAEVISLAHAIHAHLG